MSEGRSLAKKRTELGVRKRARIFRRDFWRKAGELNRQTDSGAVTEKVLDYPAISMTSPASLQDEGRSKAAQIIPGKPEGWIQIETEDSKIVPHSNFMFAELRCWKQDLFAGA
jgi:hypothetical protein